MQKKSCEKRIMITEISNLSVPGVLICKKDGNLQREVHLFSKRASTENSETHFAEKSVQPRE